MSSDQKMQDRKPIIQTRYVTKKLPFYSHADKLRFDKLAEKTIDALYEAFEHERLEDEPQPWENWLAQPSERVTSD